MEGCEKYVPRKQVKQNRKKWFIFKTGNNQSIYECYEKYAKLKHDSKSNPRDENRRVEYEKAQKEWDEVVLNAKKNSWMGMVNRVTQERNGTILLWYEFDRSKPGDYHPCIEMNNID